MHSSAVPPSAADDDELPVSQACQHVWCIVGQGQAAHAHAKLQGGHLGQAGGEKRRKKES